MSHKPITTKSIASFFGGAPALVTLVDGKAVAPQKRPRGDAASGAPPPPPPPAAAAAAASAAAGSGSVGSGAADDGTTISLAALRNEFSSGTEVEALRKSSAAAQARLQTQLALSASALAAAGAQLVQLQRQVQAGQYHVAHLKSAFAPSIELSFVRAVTAGSAQGVQYALSLGFTNLELTGPRWTRKTALMYACYNGHAAVVRALLAAGANKYTRLPGAAGGGGSGHTAFSSAQAGGHSAAVLYLLDESWRLPFGGADEETRDRRGRCTLTGAGRRGVASKEGLVRAITACLSPRDAAALLSTSRRIWRDAGERLRRACTAGNAAAVRDLLDEAGDGAASLVASAGPVAGESALMRACRVGQVGIVRLLISEGADKAAVARDDPDEYRPRRRDAFYYAELAADPAARTTLLQMLDKSRIPPMLYEGDWQRGCRSAATLTGCGGVLDQAAPVLASFLTKRERFQLAGTCRATWRHVPAGLSAKDQERVRAGSYLWRAILNGIDNVDKDESGSPMLVWAARKGDLPLVRELLDWRASPDATWDSGCTALSEALRRGHLNVATELVARGAFTSPIDDDGIIADMIDEDGDATSEGDETAPLILAISRGFTAFAHELIARGADVNARISRRFEPALAAAVRRGDAGLVRALIDKGADLEATFELLTEFDVISFTSLRLACSRGRADIVRMLVAAGCALTVEEPLESSILGDPYAMAGLSAPGTRAVVLAALQRQ